MRRDSTEEARERGEVCAVQRTNRRAGIEIVCIIANLLLICWPAVAAQNDVSRVLIIYQDSSVLKSSTEIAAGMSKRLQELPTGRLDLYTEFLDAPRYPSDADFQTAAEYMRYKYWRLSINILVPIGPEALRFVIQHRGLFAPDAQVVFGDISDRTYARLKPPKNFAGAITTYDIKRTADLAVGLQAEAASIVVFSGSSEFDAYWQSSAHEALGEKYRNLPVEYVSGLQLSAFVDRARDSDPHTILLILTIFEDSLGRKYRPREAAWEIAKASGAPSYGLLSSYVGTGIVGGHMATYESIGTAIADLVAEAASGDGPTVVHVASNSVVDWRQLQRWQMDRTHLPETSQLLNFTPSPWDQYRWQIFTVSFLILTEAIAITALYVERRSRKSAELKARSRLFELVHLNQSATAGALSASIAHELNQPLGAIRSNAEAGEALLQGDAPDLGIIKQILADIRDDDQRAGDIILRLRGMLKKRGEIELQEFDLNDVVNSAVNILHAEAEKRRVVVSVQNSAQRLPVRADKVHLQQVILNLATNALDAMADAATVDRRLAIHTALHDDAKVELSISDTGRGIPKDRLDSIFDAFYTTKSTGIGLGLSIARAIVETYSGKIWADNRAEGGAIFRFVLPLAEAV